LEEFFGLEVCGAPIGDENFIFEWLNNTSEKIIETIQNTSSKFVSRDLHIAHTVLRLSLQNRSDYIVSTNLPSHSESFVEN
jgi:frataxin-like iron-binding protein CyaY